MTKRYVVRGTSEVWRNPHEGMRIYVLAAEEDKDESEWKSVAMFRFREHADRYCAELNREEEAKAQSRLETMSVTVGGQTHTKTWMPGEVNEQELTDWANGLLSGTGWTATVTQHKDAIPPPAPFDPGRGLIKEYLTKGVDYSSTGDYQVRHVWDPSKFCEPTARAWNLSSIVKPQHTTDGERVRCCRRGADSIFMFNDEVWRNLRDDCGGHR